jgi:small subunit ribosomal protein S12
VFVVILFVLFFKIIMSTLSQLVNRDAHQKKAPSSRTFKLRKNPQVLTVMHRLFFESPKKPNSGKRRVGKCKIKHYHFRSRLTARIIGYADFPRRFARLLCRGGRMNDTPGVTYTAIRGTRDNYSLFDKRKSRSKYGRKRPEKSLFIRRCMRKIGLPKGKNIKKI